MTIINYKNYEDIPVSLSVRDVADILDISLNSAYELVRSGQIRSIKIGKQYRISKSAFLEYLEK